MVSTHSPDEINDSTNWGKVAAAMFLLGMTSELLFSSSFCTKRTHHYEANTSIDSGSDGFDIKTNKNNKNRCEEIII